MDRITKLDRFKVPLGGQEIELQQVDYAAGGISLLRIRIRERNRFTIFEIDADTAGRWGRALMEWSQQQPSAAAAERS